MSNISSGNISDITIGGDNAVKIEDGDSSLLLDVGLDSTKNAIYVQSESLAKESGGNLDTVVTPIATISSTPLQRVAVFDASDTQITSFGSGIQYTEGDIDASITGTAFMWEDSADTLRAVSSGKPLPVAVISGGTGSTQYAEDSPHSSGDTGTMALGVRKDTMGSLASADGDYTPPQFDSNGQMRVTSNPTVITNAIDSTAFDLNAAAFDTSTAITNDYILDSIQLNFSTAESKTVTITDPDGTLLYKETNTAQSISFVDINTGFNGGENIRVQVTQFSIAGTMDCLLKVRQGSTNLAGDPVLGSGTNLYGIPYDFYTEVSKGNVANHSFVNKFGRNSAVGTSYVPIALGGIYNTPQPSSATTLRVKAGNANDTAAGTGAREVTLEFLDSTGALTTEALATAGTSASSATSSTAIRLFRAYVSNSGTYATATAGSHSADIVIENSSGGTDWLTISSSGFPRSQSEVGIYSVPLGKTAYLLDYNLTSDSNKDFDFLFFKRESILGASAPYEAMRVQEEAVGVQGHIAREFKDPVKFPELTDIGFMAKVTSGTADITAEFNLLIVG